MNNPVSVRMVDLSEYIDRREGQFGLHDFISLDEAYQEDLLRILDLVRGYARETKPARPLNFYVEASPGSGKSFLIKCIVEAAQRKNGNRELEFIPFNLSQIKGSDEFLGLFEKVRTQNVHKNKLPVVFFDEVDSVIGNVHAYRHFLTPMFDGVIYRNGNEDPIGRAIFFFAASSQLVDFFRRYRKEREVAPRWLKEYFQKSSQKDDYSEWLEKEKLLKDKILSAWRKDPPKDLPDKIRDFLDRIDDFIYVAPSYLRVNQRGREEEESKRDTLRQSTLLIAALLRKYRPSLRGISILACHCLVESLMRNQSRRTAESYIFNSMNPHDGILKVVHLPPDCAKRHKSQAEAYLRGGMKKKGPKVIKMCLSEGTDAVFYLKEPEYP